MKNKSLIIFILVIVLIVYLGLFSSTKQDDYSKVNLENENALQNEEGTKSIVTIRNNTIKNEELIDEFLENVEKSNNEEHELNILQDGKEIILKFTPGQTEDEEQRFGVYSLFFNRKLEKEYPKLSYNIKRTVDNGNVILYFDGFLIEYIARPEICSYSLESSNYSKKFDLSYNQRKDLEINKIFKCDDYYIKTFGGNVDIIVEGDTRYDLKTALSQKIITNEDILNQAEMDSKYGICSKETFKDGGSTEYCYPEKYTILKKNSLEGDTDLIIGMNGSILNLYNKNK